jgi:MFS family permease
MLAKNCTKKLICEANTSIASYTIDWTSEYSLHNWMTDPTINLLCKPPYMVGLIGSISFVSYSFGSLAFTRYNDILGRKPVVQLAGVVTPLGLITLLAL